MSKRWNLIITLWKDNRWLFFLSGWLLGLVTVSSLQRVNTDILALLYDLVPETVGLVFTVFILNRFADNRAIDERKLNSFRLVKSRSTDIAVEALEQIQHQGWWDELLKHYQDNEACVDLSFVRWFGGVQLNEITLTSANLNQSNLQSATFAEANLQNTTFMEANLKDTLLGKANLQNTDLWGANLEGSFLVQANLQGAKLESVNLKNANLWAANLKNANLRNANLQGAKFDTLTLFNEKTVLPDNLYWNPDTDMTKYTNSDLWEPPYFSPQYDVDKFLTPQWVIEWRKIFFANSLT